MEIIGIFGGTFNPIHNGHLALAHTVLETLHCTQIRFIPAALPPHKTTPTVSAQHRAAMVQLAIQGHANFVLDTCELERYGASYTVETLLHQRQQFPDAALCLMMGQDSYQKLPTWHRWLELLDYCHLVVVHRAESEHNLTLHTAHQGKFIDITKAPNAFAAAHNGLISFLPITPPDISSTRMRAQLRHADDIAHNEIPPQVLHFIQENRLYLS